MQRHDLDPTSLVAGLLFAGLGLAFLLDGVGAVDLEVRWVGPALLIGLGVALLASARSPRRTEQNVEERSR
ncbi:MAG: hypothetical protein ACRDZ1_14850 [Acidimicrobiia bacterium]